MGKENECFKNHKLCKSVKASRFNKISLVAKNNNKF